MHKEGPQVVSAQTSPFPRNMAFVSIFIIEQTVKVNGKGLDLTCASQTD